MNWRVKAFSKKLSAWSRAGRRSTISRSGAGGSGATISFIRAGFGRKISSKPPLEPVLNCTLVEFKPRQALLAKLPELRIAPEFRAYPPAQL